MEKMKFKDWLTDRMSWYLREFFINRRNRKKLINNDFSLISIDCLGGIVQHDLGVKFNTPTVNLWFYPLDFLRFVNDLEHYLNCNLEFVNENGISYPVARLDDIKIYFTHYNNNKEAKEAFEKRKNRIKWDNIFVIMTDANNCTEEQIKAFDKIKYPHVIFTHKEVEGVSSAYYCKSDKNGVFHAYTRKISPKRYYDSFDFVRWFNTGELK